MKIKITLDEANEYRTLKSSAQSLLRTVEGLRSRNQALEEQVESLTQRIPTATPERIHDPSTIMGYSVK